MNEMFQRKGVVVFAVAWLVVIVAIGSSSLTLLLTGSDLANQWGTRIVNASEYDSIQRFSRLNSIYDTLMSDYYQPLDGDALVLGAIRGMMESVEDPYTFYYTPAEMTEQEEDSQGVYHGIGMVVTLREGGGVEIVRVYEDSPAVRAGLMTGDIIVAVDGESIAGDSAKDLNSVVSLIKGLDGTDVTLTVLRAGAEMQITATRGVVNLEYAQFEILDGHIGYITISQFTGNAVDGVKRAVDALKAAKVDGVIVDVRDDPGGMLDEVVEIADLFLPECMIVYMEDRAGTRTNFYSDSKYWDVPMAVLVNGGSASASEIFAAAIKENERGIIVGETTFGKGIVQTLMTFSQDGAGMQYTSASYFTPDGNSIHGIGVEPDLVVQPDETGEDAQLQAAIDALKGEE
ncbi:MAG: S41 family peptidase [Eubacteriales bacterium]|nr:S41 family peptidase [Eubacteriales bacterium]